MANPANPPVKQWRVGTWSMGIALIMTGALLGAAQFNGTSGWIDHIWLWWPLLAIVLGIEIIIHLAMSKEQSPIIRYDLFSIVALSLVGGLCLFLAAAQSTGILDEMKQSLDSEYRTVSIAPVEQELESSVKRIVLQADEWLGGSIRVDAAPSVDGAASRAAAFGDCRIAVSSGGKEPAAIEMARARTVGGTMYISLHKPAEGRGFNDTSARCNATVVLPQQMPVELDTGNNNVTLADGKLPQGWSRTKRQ
ncbi:conserved hypothetical protein [Paenibacillus curdlanolyticus YK9]|uniref:DUF5668 domain-containing protein n=1 Tax=Paenibacillus curdlanolyticus YK9 TaxID=717606 RepID=E0IEE0_9BACL|nr:hypothetical protein [Paenibacillus curdlanolyticus]EFM09028.1 conserved hypothetical protein [Paenibacillus curdlanolyticus YK9]